MEASLNSIDRAVLTAEVLEEIALLDDLDTIADLLGEILAQRYNLSFFGFSLWDEARGLFVERVPLPPEARPVHLRIEDLDDYGFGIAVKASAPRLVSDIQQDGLREGELRARETFGTRSYVTVPIYVRGHVAGALGLASSQPDYFDEEDINLLQPLVLVLGLKAGELGIQAPMDLGERLSVLPGPVLLTGTDEGLKRRVHEVLPQKLDVLREDFWTGGLERLIPSLTFFCTARLGLNEAEQIMKWLRSCPGKLVVVCHKAEPRVALQLRTEGGFYGLLAIERAGRNPGGQFEEAFAARLARWVFRDTVSVDWEALGVLMVGVDERFLRVSNAFERYPFRNWTVKGLAEATAMSLSTLGRVAKAATGRTPHQLIGDVRFQRIDSFHRSGEIPGSQLHPLFGFSSAQRMSEWRRRYRLRTQGSDSRSSHTEPS